MRNAILFGLAILCLWYLGREDKEQTAQKPPIQISDVPMNPETLRLLECTGMKIHDDKQPQMSSPTANECEILLKAEKEEDEIWRDPILSRYIADMTTATNGVFTAQIAGMCGLRSDAWFLSIRAGYLRYKDGEAKRLNLTSRQIMLAQKKLEAIKFPEVNFGTHNNTCQKILNDPNLARLDELQSTSIRSHH